MSEEILTITEVAEKLRVAVYTVRRLVWNKELPAFKVHQHWRIKKEDLEKFMQRSKA